MKLRDILDGIETVKVSADLDMEIADVCYDSRQAVSGCVFIAVRGYESDGHRFIASAVERGAVCVIAEEEPSDNVPFVIVSNTRSALAAASASFFGRPADSLRLIGVTGTNGKTTVTSLLKTVIERTTGAKAGLIGTNNVVIGDEVLEAERTTPESYEIHKTLRRMVDAGCEYAVMEVSSHALYLDRVYGLRFEVGVFTNLTVDHLDFHKNMDDYCDAKAMLFSICKRGAVNIDDEYAGRIIAAARCPVTTFSVENKDADVSAVRTRLFADRVSFTALTLGSLQEVELGIPGKFSIYNALAVIAAMMCLGQAVEDVSSALSACGGVKGRAEVVPTDAPYTVLIDYAHTPDALENIVATAKGFTKGRVVTLFGCGGDRDSTKRPVMGKIAAELSDFVVVTSDNPRTEEPGAIIKDILAGMRDTKTPYTVIENRREAIVWALENAQADDTIILAGKGHETYQIFGKEKVHFDEREVVSEFIARRKQ